MQQRRAADARLAALRDLGGAEEARMAEFGAETAAWVEGLGEAAEQVRADIAEVRRLNNGGPRNCL
jgi:hypothetical protein